VSRSVGGVLDRSVPPPTAELKPLRFPPFEHHRQPNGLHVYLASGHQTPLFQIALVTPAGGQLDPVGSAGLATLTAALLDEGTAGRSALEIAADVESLGGYLGTSADWDAAYLGTKILSDHAESGLQLIAELAMSPTFPEAEIERLRRLRLADLQRRLSQPGSVAADRLARVLYQDTAYGFPLSGTRETVEAISGNDIHSFYDRYFTPRGSALIAVGSFEPQRLLSDIHSTFGSWSGSEPTPPPAIDPPVFEGIQVHIVDRPHAVQTELRLGHIGISRRDPDYVPLQVVNALLGGKFISRLNLSLRERHGITYGAQSNFAARQGPGPFVVSTSVATEFTGQAVEETLNELHRLREEPVGADEVSEAKSYLLGVFPYTIQRIDGLAQRLEILAVHSLPDDYYDTRFQNIHAFQADLVGELAQRHLNPERIAIVAVGPAESLDKQLGGIGSVTLHREP
jgi:zinc protease